MTSPQKPSDGGGQVAILIQKAKLITELNDWVNELLEPELQPHVRVANYSEGCLTLEVDSSAWATRVLYAKPELMAGLRSSGRLPQLRTIDHRVKRRFESGAQDRRVELPPPPELSAQVVDHLKQFADSLDEGERGGLKAVLKRLVGSRKEN